MSDDTLVITGGGSLAVATDDQLDRVQRLEAFVDTARAIVTQLSGVSGSISAAELRAAGAPQTAFDAERELELSITLLSQAADHTAGAAKLTRAAMVAYGADERKRIAEMRELAASIGRYLGFLYGPGILLTGAALVAGMGLISPATTSTKGGSSPFQFLNDNPAIADNPAFIEAVKLIVDSMDDSVVASMPLPAWLLVKLKGLGLEGPELAAAILIATGGPMGKLKDSAVALTKSRTTTGKGAPPAGWEERIARIPDTANNGGYQIRIDRFVDAHGKRSFEVYLSGTQTFSTSKTGTPFDMTSNMKGIAGEPNASLAAVEKAMKAAGIKPGDPVNITGHSQGGLVAHEVAATGHWNVRVALEAGPPASQTPVPGSTTEVVIAHNEDIVTALGGSRTDDKAIVVHATAFPNGQLPTGESTPPAHNTDRYQHTAKLLDDASSSMVNDAKQKANASEKGASSTVTTTLYKAQRVWNE